MAHRYKDLIQVEITKTAPGAGFLRAFTWRGMRYPVVEVLSSWHLKSWWWDRERHSNRHYRRVQTPGFCVYEVYYDQVPGVWVLDVVLD